MEKILFEIYHTYGKGDGDELVESYTGADSREERENILKEWSGSETFESEEDFLDGSSNYINYEIYGGDWDDPTGRYIVCSSYEQKLEEINKEHAKKLANLNKAFNKEA